MERIYENLTELVGHTPLLHLSRLSQAWGIDPSTVCWQNWNISIPEAVLRTVWRLT